MRLSIRKKAIIMIIVFAFVLITAATGMYARVIVNMTSRQYSERAESLAATVAQFVDVETVAALRNQVETVYDSVENKVFSDKWGEDDWNEYIANFAGIEQSKAYLALRETLRKFQDNNDADCIYLTYVDPAGEAFVYLIDAAYEDACPPGCIDVVYDVNREILTNPDRGFPAYTTDTEEYGKLITAGVPIYYNGNVIAYSMVDYSIGVLHDEQAKSVWKLYGYLVSTTVLICIAAVFVLKFILVDPIKLLTDASRRYADKKPDGEGDVFSELNIKTHDELQELAEAMKNMEIQINNNIKELIDMNDRLIASQNVASEMSELANKDALTDVKNKTAYERYIQKMDEDIRNNSRPEFGIAMFDLDSLKQINDTQGHSCGDAAIVSLAKMICDTFVRSPVFRIGGDEFTVILQNEDYKHAERLIGQFQRRMEETAADDSLPSETRVTASFGYAEFDRATDKCYADVFNRADKFMYENKMRQKEKQL